MKKNRKGFTLIELLIVVAIIGIIVAIAIPNLLNAIQRAKQRRSMGDIRSIATAVEAYAVDFNRYPPAAAFAWGVGAAENLAQPTNTLLAVSGYISPTYIRVTPLADGWNSWFTYGVGGNGSAYTLVTTAKNGTINLCPDGDGPMWLTTDFNSDIIYINGQFVQYPEGVQR
jgi:type II secretion system protein G